VYTLDTSGMTQLTGGATGVDSLELSPGETADLPNGWGTVTFEDASGGTDPMQSIRRFASLQIQHDAGATWVLIFATIATLGLIAGLLIPRRRIWVQASTTTEGTVRIEYAGLARGEDPQLDRAVAAVRSQLRDALAAPVRADSERG